MHFLLMLLPFLQAGKALSQVSTVVEIYKSSVFTLEAYDEFGVQRAIGTGFFTSAKGDAITSYSLLRKGRIALASLENGEAYPITEKVMSSRDGDIVAYYVPTGGKTFQPIPMSKGLPDMGTELFIIGTHDGYPNCIDPLILGHF
jgi:hypothetical protein